MRGAAIAYAAAAALLLGAGEAGALARPPRCIATLRSRVVVRASAEAAEPLPDLDAYIHELVGLTEADLEAEAARDAIDTRRFVVDGAINSDSDEVDEFKLMYKLRKELGDADFKAIFGTLKVSGPALDGPSLPGR
jgi:hypothetical protein